MAKNWTVAEAINEVVAGNKEAIVDLGKRFPLTTVAMASDPKKVLEALNFITVRKIESILKDGVQVIEDDEEGITDPVTEKPEEKKAGRGRKAKKEEPMNEPEDAEEEVDLKKMSEVDLFKLAKKKGLKPEPKKNKKYYIDLITKADEPAEEEDWDDEEEEKPAKKAPAKKEAPKKEAPKKAEVEDDDDWDI